MHGAWHHCGHHGKPQNNCQVSLCSFYISIFVNKAVLAFTSQRVPETTQLSTLERASKERERGGGGGGSDSVRVSILSIHAQDLQTSALPTSKTKQTKV